MNDIQKEIKELIAPNDIYVIFENGEVQEDNLGTFGQISKDFDNHKVDFLTPETNNFNFLNFSNDSIIKIFHIINQEDTFETIINVSKDVNVTIYEYLIVESSCVVRTEFVGQENSNTKLLAIKKGNLDDKLHYSFKSYLTRSAHLQLHHFSANKGEGSDLITGELLAEQSSFMIYAVDINNSQKTHQIDVIARHKVGYSESKFSCFGMAGNKSHSIINTIGIIENKSTKSNMNHNIKGILLDEDSTINTNPILDIEEYDVIASHGASVGDLSDDELYYLMSRGLTLEQSQKLILSGLVLPILDGFDDELYHDYVNRLIHENL